MNLIMPIEPISGSYATFSYTIKIICTLILIFMISAIISCFIVFGVDYFEKTEYKDVGKTEKRYFGFDTGKFAISNYESPSLEKSRRYFIDSNIDESK